MTRSDGGTDMPGDGPLLQAAYDMLTSAGNDHGWEIYVDQAHHYLGLLLARIAHHGSIWPEPLSDRAAKCLMHIDRNSGPGQQCVETTDLVDSATGEYPLCAEHGGVPRTAGEEAP